MFLAKHILFSLLFITLKLSFCWKNCVFMDLFKLLLLKLKVSKQTLDNLSFKSSRCTSKLFISNVKVFSLKRMHLWEFEKYEATIENKLKYCPIKAGWCSSKTRIHVTSFSSIPHYSNVRLISKSIWNKTPVLLH